MSISNVVESIIFPSYKQDLNTWVKQSKALSLDHIKTNISPDDGLQGSVLASPQRSNPDYYYHWVRDAARTMSQIVLEYARTSGEEQKNYGRMLEDYVEFTKINQTTPTPSNSVGEPKFYVNGQAYFFPWGRPQNDGPAQRSLVLTRWSHELIANDQKDYVTGVLYDGTDPSFSVIKTDLEFVAHHWQDPCFDLWEEVNGTHFYTRMLQRSSLREGAELAEILGDTGAANFYNQQAELIENSLSEFWDDEKGYFVATLDYVGGLNYKSSNLDAAVIIATDQAYSAKFPFLTPCSDQMLASSYALHQAFDSLYSINSVNQTMEGEPIFPGIGRYPEDKYNGSNSNGPANPWFLCTLALSMVSYKASTLFKSEGSITVTSKNIDYLTMSLNTLNSRLKLKVGETHQAKSATFKTLCNALIALGDAYLNRVRLHMGECGALSEQFDRSTGYMTSARDLTWSYVAFFATADWREQSLSR